MTLLAAAAAPVAAIAAATFGGPVYGLCTTRALTVLRKHFPMKP